MAKQQVRRETDLFLNESQGSRTYYPNNLHALPDSEVAPGEDYNLTGAREPLLPFRIAISQKDGKRVEFVMLISPNNVNHGKTNATSSAYTRLGWIQQLWGPNQDVITANGRTAAFMAPKAGITTFYRKQSFAYLNFMALMNSFKNNGYKIFDPTMGREVVRIANSRVIDTISGVEISFDNDIFTGHFNTFTLDEAAENPFTFNYNFEFIISSSSRDFGEVRGHFVHIPDRQQTPQLDTTVLLDDVYGHSNFSSPRSHADVREWRSRNEQATYRLWRDKTGLPWSEAIERGYTDGSGKENLRLRGQLLAGQVVV